MKPYPSQELRAEADVIRRAMDLDDDGAGWTAHNLLFLARVVIAILGHLEQKKEG